MHDSGPAHRKPQLANARHTATLGTVLAGLFALEVVTVILGVRGHLSLHVATGLFFAGVVVCKIGTTGWRIVQYYRGRPDFVAAGPPTVIMRIVGLALAATSATLVVAGLLTFIGPKGIHSTSLLIHEASAYALLGLVIIHTSVHLLEAVNLSLADITNRIPVEGRRMRFGTLAGALLVSACTSAIAVGHSSTYLRLFTRR